MARPTPSAIPVTAMARARARASRPRGRSAIRSAPAAGVKTAIVTADRSQPLIRSRPREHDGQDDHAHDQERGVALHAARLEVPEDPTGETGTGPRSVDGAVDDAAVHHV